MKMYYCNNNDNKFTFDKLFFMDGRGRDNNYTIQFTIHSVCSAYSTVQYLALVYNYVGHGYVRFSRLE